MVYSNSTSRKVFMVFNTLILGILALSCILPFINILAISFSDQLAVTENRVGFLPIGFNTAAYEFILSRPAFLGATWISVQRTVIGLAVNLVLIVLTAYPLSKTKSEFRLRAFFSWFFVITILFHPGIIPAYMIVFTTGLIDSLWSLILPGALPVFSMLVVMNYMRSLPKELEEAAYIDGAGHIDTLVKVILPLCKPTLATVALFSFVHHWNSWFDGQLFMMSVDRYPLQTYLRTMIIQPEAFFRNMTAVGGD
ncbi:MAG: carbohydrate ABC transporter permease, partial [Defluviitaleaceae bacterium]|nr:carbohydrate ABC transporter permease [Defluviitaleaceae bacterium]